MKSAMNWPNRGKDQMALQDEDFVELRRGAVSEDVGRVVDRDTVAEVSAIGHELGEVPHPGEALASGTSGLAGDHHQE